MIAVGTNNTIRLFNIPIMDNPTRPNVASPLKEACPSAETITSVTAASKNLELSELLIFVNPIIKPTTINIPIITACALIPSQD